MDEKYGGRLIFSVWAPYFIGRRRQLGNWRGASGGLWGLRIATEAWLGPLRACSVAADVQRSGHLAGIEHWVDALH